MAHLWTQQEMKQLAQVFRMARITLTLVKYHIMDGLEQFSWTVAKLDKKEKSETESTMPNHFAKRLSESSIPVWAAKLEEKPIDPDRNLTDNQKQSILHCMRPLLGCQEWV